MELIGKGEAVWQDEIEEMPPVEFHNVFGSDVVCKPGEWPIAVRAIRNEILRIGLYGIGPVMYRVMEPEDKSIPGGLKYQFRIPINRNIRMDEDSPYTFTAHWKIEYALVIRHPDADAEMAFSYELHRADF